MRSAVTAIISALSFCALSPQDAFAHKQSVRRMLALETAGKDELHVIASIRIPGGEARAALLLVVDQNRDGQLGEAERKLLRAMLAERALDGVAIRTATATLTLANIEVADRVDPTGGPIEVMVHATAKTAGSELSVITGSVGDPLDLFVLSGSRPVVEASRGRVEKGTVKTTMSTGDRVTLRIAETLVGPAHGR